MSAPSLSSYGFILKKGEDPLSPYAHPDAAAAKNQLTTLAKGTRTSLVSRTLTSRVSLPALRLKTKPLAVDTVRMKVLPSDEPLFMGGLFNSMVKSVALEARPEVARSTAFEVCIQKTETSSCRPVALPTEVRERWLSFLKTGGPKGRCCSYFVNELHGQPWKGPCPGPSDLSEHWDFQHLDKKESLVPGDTICLAKDASLESIQHYAMYLDDGLFVSIYGNDNPVFVSDLKNLKAAYKAHYVYKMTPK